MNSKDIQRLARKVSTGAIASRHNDPAFYSGLSVLPNPDPILRAMGKADETYAAIMADPHVIGELRSLRSGLLAYQLRAVANTDAPDTPVQQQALELCQSILKRRPAPGVTWKDRTWTMAEAILRGIRVHEVIWQLDGGQLLPVQLLDRPNRRFRFDHENQLRLLTKAQPIEGEETEDYKFLVSRHMASTDNPYGQALLSSCFWPYTFKHGGFKLFYQFCERYGLPWPVGKYPAGTPVNEQNELLDALLNMLEAGAAAIPEGNQIDLMTVNHSGELVQESLIHLCNREMSKALTSQTLSTEMRQVGSNAASKTHREREQGVQEADRAIIESTLNELFADAVQFNFGDDVIPPLCQLFKEEKKATKERAEIWKTAAEIGNPSREAFHNEMGIPQAKDDNDRLQLQPQQPASFSTAQPSLTFASSDPTLTDQAAQQADTAIEADLLQPVLAHLTEYERQGKSLQQFLDDLPQLFNALDSTELIELNQLAIRTALAEGIASA